MTVKAQVRIACDQTVTSSAQASNAAKANAAKVRVAGDKRGIHDKENRNVRTLRRKKRRRVSNGRVSSSRASNGRASKRVGDSLAIERKVIVKVPRLSVVVVASDRHWIGLQPKGSSELL